MVFSGIPLKHVPFPVFVGATPAGPAIILRDVVAHSGLLYIFFLRVLATLR